MPSSQLLGSSVTGYVLNRRLTSRPTFWEDLVAYGLVCDGVLGTGLVCNGSESRVHVGSQRTIDVSRKREVCR